LYESHCRGVTDAAPGERSRRGRSDAKVSRNRGFAVGAQRTLDPQLLDAFIDDAELCLAA
jgi:hypothetical protein